MRHVLRARFATALSLAPLLAGALAACSGRGASSEPRAAEAAPRPAGESPAAVLRVALASPGGELPFFVEIPASDRGVARVRNGEESIDVAFSRDGAGAITLDFPHFDSRLTLAPSERGAFAGQWRRFGSDGQYETMRATAAAVESAATDRRFAGAAEAAPAADYAGVWRMNFAEDGLAKGVFRQAPDGALSGTILTPTGDYRFLAGDVVDGRLRLSVFDGAHAFLFHGELRADDSTAMTGDFWSRTTWHDPFTATRLPPGEDFDLPDPFRETTLVSADRRLRLPPLEDPRYTGKAVIVQLFGTWCPNCHDEAPILADYYNRFHSDGLEILSLAYEYGDDPARIDRQIERYRKRFGVDWEIIWSGSSKKEEASRTLPDLSSVKAFPTTIFLNRDHSVRAIHAGFAGPATGAEHLALLKEFDRLVRAILDSPPPS